MWPLEPGRDDVLEMAGRAADVVADFLAGLPEAPAFDTADAESLVEQLLRAPPDQPGGLDGLLQEFRAAAAKAAETAGPSYMAYIGGGDLYTAAVAEFLTRATHRFTGLAGLAPALVAMEESILRWLGLELGLPSSSVGQLTTGGSMGTLSAFMAAREDRLGERIDDGVAYITEQTHGCAAKTARIVGLRPHQLRVVPTSADLRMDPAAAEAMIAADRAAGLRPFLLVASAGTTNTGAVDPLPDLADAAERHGLWFHVDGAYGGLFHLVERGRERLAGMNRADSLVLDPHKTLFMPYGTGVVLVRDAAALRRAFAVDADYLQDLDDDRALPDYADLGLELTREHRGFRMWLPLHLHGLAAFRDTLNEKLDLAEYAYKALSGEPGLELPWRPELSIVAFRWRGLGRGDGAAEAESANQELLRRVNASQRVHISSTRIDGRLTLRLCLLAHRVHHDRVEEAVDIITTAARAIR